MLVYSVMLFWKYDFYLTMDGPSHLYNSSLLNFYDKSDFLKQYLEKNNPLLLPNYTDHIILQFLFKFFSTTIAHKLLLCIIVIFIPITFKLAIRAVSNNKGNFSFMIFPLLFNSLLHFGFYNFNLAFVFLNLQILLTVFIINKTKRYYLFLFLFALNSVILFYTHAFVFAIAMAISFILVLFKHHKNFKDLMLSGLTLLVISAPALLPFYLFNSKFQIVNYDIDITTYEKLKDLIFFSPAIVYWVENEAPYSLVISILSIVLIAYILSKKEGFFHFYLADVFLILAIIIFPVLIFTKNGMLSGMLSFRLILLIYYFLFFWIASTAIKNKIITFISISMILFSFINLAEIRHFPLLMSSEDALDVIKMREKIKDRSVVYPINMIEYHDTYGHYSNCLGFNKEIIISENYEAELGWFPLKWKSGVKPIACQLQNKDIQLPDYVFLSGALSLLHVKKPAEKMFIDSVCTEIYRSEDSLITLYLVNKEKAK